jgi:hypothetical protein
VKYWKYPKELKIKDRMKINLLNQTMDKVQKYTADNHCKITFGIYFGDHFVQFCKLKIGWNIFVEAGVAQTV